MRVASGIMKTVMRFALTCSVAAGLLVGTAGASAPVRRYDDPRHRFHFSFPGDCASARGAANQSDVVSCNNGTAYVIFAPGGTDQPALQRLVNHIIGDWGGMMLIRNDRRAKLDHRPARSMFAVGTRPDREVANIQIVATAKDGGWYALVCQSSTWEGDSRSYFLTILQSLHFEG